MASVGTPERVIFRLHHPGRDTERMSLYFQSKIFLEIYQFEENTCLV